MKQLERKIDRGPVPASALIRERSKSLELEFPPSYSYSSTISCWSVGSQPPRTTEMSVVILSIRPTAHFCRTLKKGAPKNDTVNLLTRGIREIFENDNLYILHFLSYIIYLKNIFYPYHIKYIIKNIKFL